jgi:hypothetical protein
MPADDAAPRTGPGASPGATPVPTEAPTPARAPAEILRDIEAERAGLTEAVASLRQEVDAARARIFSKRTLGIVAGSLVTLVALRARRRRRRRG